MANKIILSVFLIGFILRLLLPMDRVFNFDQDQIALNALKISQGDATALGPQVSGMSFFTGPLIYYIAAGFYKLTNYHPIANAFTSISIFVGSFWLIWLFFNKLFIKKIVILYLSLYALSPLFVQLDRITWNPNLSFISASLVLSALLVPKSFVGIWLGMFLAYQSHFSGFILPLILGLYLLWQRRNFKLVLIGLSGFFTSLIPLMIFDSRHQWQNFISLFKFIYICITEIGLSFIQRIQIVTMICFENFTKILSGYFFPQLVLVIIGLIIFILWLRQSRSIFSPVQKKILLLWFITWPLAALFYNDDTPEYYFLMQFPALVFILTDLLIKTKAKLLIFIFLAVVSLAVVFDKNNQYLLKEKYNAAKYIHSQSAGKPIQIVFDMDYREQFGWDYLFKYFKFNLSSYAEHVHLIYPVLPSTRFSGRFGDLGVFSQNFIEYNKLDL